jgi:hypothetical protein
VGNQVSDDLYKILQVDPEADSDVIEAAYRRLARKHHPDVSPAPDAELRMRELNAAYQVLRHAGQRADYDRRRQPAGPLAGACHRHASRAAAGWCDTCGSGLCGACAARFRPATCGPCVIRWARRRQVAGVVSLMAAAMLLLAVGGLATWLAAREPALPRLAMGVVDVDVAAALAMGSVAVVAGLVGGSLWRLHRLREAMTEALA